MQMRLAHSDWRGNPGFLRVRNGLSAGMIIVLSLICRSCPARAVSPDSLLVIQSAGIELPGGDVEVVTLLGKPFDPGSTFLASVYLQRGDALPVQLPEGSGSGYDPRMTLCDFTGDGIDEIFISINSGGSGGIMSGLVYQRVADGGLSILFDTSGGPLTPLSGRFLDDYHVEVCVMDTTVVIDLADRADMYEEQGIFHEAHPAPDVEPWGGAYGFFEIGDPDGTGGCDLICWQSLRGAYNADRVAIVRTVLSWNDDRWQVTDIAIAPYGSLRPKLPEK